MLLWYLWIVTAALVKTSQGSLPPFTNIHRESFGKNEGNPVKRGDEHLLVTNDTAQPDDDFHLVPKIKPEKIFPLKRDNKSVGDGIKNSGNENFQKTAEVHKSKSPFDKTEKVSTSKEKDEIKKEETVKKSKDEDKLIEKKLGNESLVTEMEDKIPHSTPLYHFPVNMSVTPSEPIHGMSVPVPPKIFPANLSLPLNKPEGIVVNTPLPKLPSSPLNKSAEALESNKNVTVTNKMSSKENNPLEAVDMNNSSSKYHGECDVDDIQHIANETNSKNCSPKTNFTVGEKDKTPESSTIAGQHPDSEVIPGFDSNGPHSIPQEKGLKKQVNISSNNNNNQQSVHINTNKVSEKMTMGPTQENHEETSTFQVMGNGLMIFVVSLATLATFSYIGLVIWRKIMIRRSGREILINEEEFCEECTDSHQFEMNQQQNRNIII